MKTALVIIAAILYTTATTVSAQGCYGMSGKRVYVIANDGQRLARCDGCGPTAYAGVVQSAGVHGKSGDAFAMWTLEDVGTNKCALRSDNGNYLARCFGCWKGAVFSDAVFVHVPNPNGAYAQWTMEKYGELFAFKADTLKYMARCSGCVPGGLKSDFAFVYSEVPIEAGLWRIQVV